MIHFMQRQIALARNSHTKRSVAKHFDTDQLSARSTDMFFLNLTIDLRYLFQIQFARQHHYIGKLRVKLQGFCIRDIQLRRQMHFLANLVGIAHHRHIGGNHSRNTRFLGRVDNGTHQFNILVIYDGIHRQITLHSMFVTGPGYLAQVLNGECIGRTCTHVQILNTKINRIGSRLDGCRERFA